MNYTTYLLLLIAIVSEVIATSALKATEGFTKLMPSVVTVLGYASAFYFLSLTLKTIPVGIAYATWSGLGIVLVSLFAWVFYKQSLNVPTMLGMGMIIAGVVLVNIYSEGH